MTLPATVHSATTTRGLAGTPAYSMRTAVILPVDRTVRTYRSMSMTRPLKKAGMRGLLQKSITASSLRINDAIFNL